MYADRSLISVLISISGDIVYWESNKNWQWYKVTIKFIILICKNTQNEMLEHAKLEKRNSKELTEFIIMHIVLQVWYINYLLVLETLVISLIVHVQTVI